MIRKAFKMFVHPDQHAEYERRHNPIWPELEEMLRGHGVSSYSIYLDATTSELFACVEIESEEKWKSVADTEVCQRWWKHMQAVMPSTPNGGPVCHELREVFHMERP